MDDQQPKTLSRNAKAVIAAGLIALVAVAGYARFGSAPAPVTVAECQPALAKAIAAAAFAKGEVAIFRPAKVSQNLTALSFLDADGKPVKLAALSGKTLLVNFWATWCVPCRTEMPALDRLQAERGGDDFQVVAINLDVESTTEREKAFLNEIGATHLAFYSDPNLTLTADLKRRGLVFGLPTTLLVDDKGCRVGSAEGGAAWDSAEAKALIGFAANPLKT